MSTSQQYIRAKRTNQTIFLWVEANDTIELVRKKISAIIKTPADKIRVLSTESKPLEDNKTLQELKIENDNVVYWIQKKDDGSWEDVNLQKITTLQQAFPGLLVGFSDHTQGPLASALALAHGARIFEKHFTLDHDFAGPDHWFSDDPPALAEWISTIHCANTMLGSPYVRPTQAELHMRGVARRSVVALRDISMGEKFNTQNLGLRRPGGGLAPALFNQLMGLTASRNIRQGAHIAFGDMKT